MSRNLWPHEQIISGAFAQEGSRVYAGTFSNCNFDDAEKNQTKGYRIDALEKAADACRNALFLTDPQVDRESVISAKGKRVAGTCEWITQNAKYCAWLNGKDSSGGIDDEDTRLLWISGGPGKGKTMLSVFLTEELERYTARIDNAELVFFFCSAQDEKRSTAVAMLRGLVHQIISKRPQLVKHVLLHFKTPERTQKTLSSLETLWLIFSKLVTDAELGTIFCVLDGLDECEESTLRVLLPRIVNLFAVESFSPTKGTLKLAIVSRDIPRLRSCPMKVRLDPDNDDKVASDIELFVSVRVQELSRIEGFSSNFRAFVQKSLLKRAERTFLWVGFAMNELSQKETCSEILEALEEVPSGLPAIYDRMLLRIPAKQRQISQAILRWVTMAVRPLQLHELAAAIPGVQSESPQITVEQAVRDAIILCGPLLKIQDKEVSLIHQSAQNYLLRDKRDNNAVLEAFRLEAESAHLKLAQECLSCIARSDLQQRAINLGATPDNQESPLLRYAIHHWPKHARSCSAFAIQLFDPSGFFLKTKSSLRVHWWKTYLKTEEEEVDLPLHLPLLHKACILGIIPWVEAVLAKKSPRLTCYERVNKKDSNGRTALYWAIRVGKEAVVRLLLDRGADIEEKDLNGKTLLCLAAQEEDEAVVRLLVDRGADVNAKDNFGGTALHCAAGQGNEAVVRLLVDRGADVNAKNSYSEAVLHWAFSGGNEAVLRLLVDRGADIEEKDRGGETLLCLAAQEEDEAVVRLLVDRGADVKAKNRNGEIALHWAAWNGSEAVVRLLIERGADVEAKDDDGKTVLHWAARGGCEAVVRLLIERGADVEAKNNDGKTVLDLAAEEGCEAVVRLLVDRGADVKEDSNGRKAL